MARAKDSGNGRLSESLAAMQKAQTDMLQALAKLAQNQTSLLQTVTHLTQRMAQTDADIAETNRINSDLFARIKTILAEHSEALAALPEAIHRRFGFRPPEGSS
jgi:septal ring factor EnvC (AmiA/AmiB activator)